MLSNKICAPPAATYMRPGAGPCRKPATFPFPLMSTASLRVVGHECHTPLQHNEVLHRYTCYTHTPRNSGADEMTMKLRWQWKWDGNYLTRTREKNTKEEGKSKHQHLARSMQALKWQGKKKRRADGNGTRPAEEGEDGSAGTNLPQRNVSLPKHAQDPTYL